MRASCLLLGMLMACALTLSIGCPAPAMAGLLGRYRVQTPSGQQLKVNESARYSNSLHAGGYGYTYQRPREDRVIELPEDGDFWHFTVISNGNQDSQRIERYLSESPRLNALASQTIYHKFNPQHPHAARYYANDPKPVIALQTERGQVIYKFSAGNLPKNAEEMADEIESAIWAHVADCGPDCKPDETKPESRVPEMRKKDPSGGGFEQSDLVVVALAVVVVLAIVAAIRARQ